MADPNMTKNTDTNSNETMQREQARSEGGGGSDRQREQGGLDKDRQEKGALGGQAKGDEQFKDKSRESDKSRSEPTGQR